MSTAAIDRVALWVLALAFAIGFGGIDPIGWDEFGPLRWFALPTLILIAATLYLNEPRMLSSLVMKVWVALLLWGLLCVFFAADPVGAWLGSGDRRLGYLTWLVFFVAFAVGRLIGQRSTADPNSISSNQISSSQISSDSARRGMLRGSVVGMIGAGLYTCIELAAAWVPLEVLLVDSSFVGGRPGGTFGQPAYLGAAAVLGLWLCLAASVDEVGRWRQAAFVSSFLSLFVLITSQARAAWLGFAVAILLFTWQQRSALRGWITRPLGRIMAAAGALTIAVAAVVTPVGSRLSSSFGSDGVISGRVDEWAVGVRALAARPLVGYGPEGYRTVFGRYVDESYVMQWGRDVITDRAHSGPLDVGLSFGVLGMLLYVVILALVGRKAVAVAKQQDAMAMISLGVLAFGIQGLFLFPLASIDPLFWLAAGVVSGTAISKSTVARNASGSNERKVGQARPFYVSGALYGVTLIVALLGGLELVANVFATAANDRPNTEIVSDGNANAERMHDAINLRPDSVRYRFIASRLDRGNGHIDAALNHIDEALVISPEDPALLNERAELLLALAITGPDDSQRDERFNNATEAIQFALERDPLQPSLWEKRGVALAAQGELSFALEAFDEGLRLDPDSTSLPLYREDVAKLIAGQE